MSGQVEKPLHVRVAEALGWEGCFLAGNFMVPDSDLWMGRKPGEMVVGKEGFSGVPRFDTSWSATGPLVEKYNIMLQPCGRHMNCTHGWSAICLFDEETHLIEEIGDTPLLAICHLILALKEVGKL